MNNVLRPMPVLVRRAMCGLPISDDERAALAAHIERHERALARFFIIVPLLAIALAAAVLWVAL